MNMIMTMFKLMNMIMTVKEIMVSYYHHEAHTYHPLSPDFSPQAPGIKLHAS